MSVHGAARHRLDLVELADHAPGDVRRLVASARAAAQLVLHQRLDARLPDHLALPVVREARVSSCPRWISPM